MAGERRIRLGSDTDFDYEIRDSDPNGADFILEHTPSGATFEYDATENAWIPTDPIGTANRKASAVTTTDVNTDDLSVSTAAAQFALNGLVVPVADGLTLADAVDPASTTTPIQDADTAIVNTGNRGTILLPFGTVTEGATYNPSDTVSIVGWGWRTSTIEFTTTGSSAHGFEFTTGRKFTEYEGFTIRGPGDDVTTGQAVRFDFANPASRMSFDQIEIVGWADDGIFSTAGSASIFQTDFRNIWIANNDHSAGTDIGYGIYMQTSGAGNVYDNVYINPSATQSSSNSRAARFGGGDNDISTLVVGGASGRGLQKDGNTNVDVDFIHYEPLNQQSSAPDVVLSDGTGSMSVGAVSIIGGGNGVVVDTVYRERDGNSTLGPISTTKTPTINNSRVTVPADMSETSEYSGTLAEIDNQSGASLSAAMAASDGLKTSTGVGYDDTEDYRIDDTLHELPSAQTLSPGFDSWTTPSTSRPGWLNVWVRGETDGSNSATVDVEIDESGGTTSDYEIRVLYVGDNNNANTLHHDTENIPLTNGASFRINNQNDPNNANQISQVLYWQL